MSLTISQMNLAPNAQQAARIVQDRHPTVVFTSGRRDVRQQAAAMAENTIRYGVSWLGMTYKNKEMVEDLERWTQENLDKTGSLPMMTQGFYDTLMNTQAGQLSQFPHCRGDAFDIQCPRFASGQIDEQEVLKIKHTIETLPNELGLQLILTREGEHRVLHAQFAHAQESALV